MAWWKRPTHLSCLSHMLWLVPVAEGQSTDTRDSGSLWSCDECVPPHRVVIWLVLEREESLSLEYHSSPKPQVRRQTGFTSLASNLSACRCKRHSRNVGDLKKKCNQNKNGRGCAATLLAGVQGYGKEYSDRYERGLRRDKGTRRRSKSMQYIRRKTYNSSRVPSGVCDVWQR